MFRKTLFGLMAGATALACATPAAAQQFYIGRILMVGYNFCPVDTLEADGRLLPVADYRDLFALYGTTHGGDGTTSFALPDLRGRTPFQWSQGPGLSPHALGATGGAETVTLAAINLPPHQHLGAAAAVNAAANTDDPTNAAPADFPAGQSVYNNQVLPTTRMAAGTAAIAPAGGGEPIPSRSPYLVLRFCVVTAGVVPPQS